jgi:hypothetical protein
MKWVALLFFLIWPFLVAGIGVGLVASNELTDSRVWLLLTISLLGGPGLLILLARHLPPTWPCYTRILAATVFVVPAVLVEVCLAYLAFLVGYVLVGGHIPA